MTPKTVTARAVSGWFGHAHEDRAVDDVAVAESMSEPSLVNITGARAGEGDAPRAGAEGVGRVGRRPELDELLAALERESRRPAS